MPATKNEADVLWYWHLLQKYKNAATPAMKQYILDIEIRTRFVETEQPRVKKLLGDFINKHTPNGGEVA